MVEFNLEYDGPEGHSVLSPPVGKIYITNLPGEDEEAKLYLTPEKLESLDLSTYIDLMIVNLQRLKRQAKKRLSTYRKMNR